MISGGGAGLIDIDDLLGMGDSQPQAQSQSIPNQNLLGGLDFGVSTSQPTVAQLS